MREVAHKRARLPRGDVSAGTSEPERRRFTVDEYFRMAEAGVFAPKEPIELLDGEIYLMSPQGRSHLFIVSLLAALLRKAYGRGHVVLTHSTLRLEPDDAPEPDVYVMPGTHEEYLRGKPFEPIFVAEVAVSSQKRDREMKASLYARAKIPEYWLVDLKEDVVLVHRKPAKDAKARFGWFYREVRRVKKGKLRPLAAKGEVSVARLFVR